MFEIGSITKSFTAAAIFGLVDEGTLALDNRVGDLLSDLRGPVRDVTVAQLLLHTSGLAGAHGDDHQPLDRAAAVAAISALDLAFEPGTDDSYSNAGYTLLALIIEEVSGMTERSEGIPGARAPASRTGDGARGRSPREEMTYREHMATAVLALPDRSTAGGFWDGEPAAPGPRAVGYLDGGEPGEAGDFPGPHWALDGNGGLAMTAPQLATWTTALFDGAIVSPASVDAMSRPRVDQGDGMSLTPGWVSVDASVFGEPALAPPVVAAMSATMP